VRELLSKLVAGGLSAAVILLWWPRFFPVDNATTWLVRGVVWTLSFELLLHALLPLERSLWDSRAGEKVRAGASRARTRSMRGRAVVACGALTVPLALLSFAPAPPARSAPKAAVRHVTEVRRIVKVERRQVRVAKVVPVPAAAPQPAPVTDRSSAAPQPRVVKPKPRSQPSTRDDPTAAPEANTSPQDTQTTQQQPVSSPRVVRRARPA
jgi:hypothetical protein